MFRHEFVFLLWLREMDPFSVSYIQEKNNVCELYFPKRLKTVTTDFATVVGQRQALMMMAA